MCASGVYDTALGLDKHCRGCGICSFDIVIVEAPIISYNLGHLSANARSYSLSLLYVQGRYITRLFLQRAIQLYQAKQ